MQPITNANTKRQEQLEALGFAGEADYADHQRVLENMRTLTQQQLATHRASPKQIVHLSETGVNAGRRLCLAPRDQTSVHAMYAPLDTPSFRENVCEQCLTTWAMEAYEEGDSMPDFIAEARAVAMQRTANSSLDTNAIDGQ